MQFVSRACAALSRPLSHRQEEGMPRVSRKQAEKHRLDVIQAAARLIPELGIDGVSVPALMAEAGLTHGAFYGHFPSKEALIVAACGEAFAQKCAYYDEIAGRFPDDAKSARAVFIKRYTHRNHVDQRGDGCPMAALAGDVGRVERKGPIREAFAAGVEALVHRLTSLLANGRKKGQREEALASASLLIGALVMARATEGHPISEEFLSAARKTMLDG
jgi:TetR/AcrR family transcriptional repressor of nem operon